MKHPNKISSIIFATILVLVLVPAVSAKAAPPPVAKPIIVPGMSQEEIDQANAEYQKELAEREKEEAERAALQEKIKKSFERVKKSAGKNYNFDNPRREPDILGFHFFITKRTVAKTHEPAKAIWVDATVNNKKEVRFIIGKKSYSEKSFIKALKAKKF